MCSSDLLEEQISKVWLDELLGERRLALSVEDVKDFRTIPHFAQDLERRVQGILRVDARTFRDGTARLDVQSELDGLALALVLADAEFPGYRIHIREASPNALTLAFSAAD